jgi:hypothetical protein
MFVFTNGGWLMRQAVELCQGMSAPSQILVIKHHNYIQPGSRRLLKQLRHDHLLAFANLLDEVIIKRSRLAEP